METLEHASFFWQSQRHLSNVKDDLPKPNVNDSKAISSPLRRIHNPTSSRVLALSPVPEISSKLPTIEDLAPHEIISIQKNHTDYICGVARKGRICKNSLYCNKHTLAERRSVKRSMSLQKLMKNECQNRNSYAKRWAHAKSFYSGKNYWMDHNPYSNDMRTCFHTSCVNTPDSEATPSYAVSTNSRGEEYKATWRATLIKKSYQKKLSRTSGENSLEFVSYILYKLENYDTFDEELRIRELEARWEFFL